MSDSKNSQRKTQAKVRELEALKLRLNGTGYEGIAQALGMSVSGAYGCVRRALERIIEETSEQAEILRQLENERLDYMLQACSKRIEDGDLSAIDRALRIMERRARLYGLDRPQKIDINVGDLDREIEEELKCLAGSREEATA